MASRISGEPLIEVLRGKHVESVHDVAAYAVDAHGLVIFSMGDVDEPVYLRSSAKPFIAATALLAGVVEQFGLEPPEIAVMAASHAAEPFHIHAVRSILNKIGMDESALQCYAEPAALYDNCSGKHAGILALCKAIGADPATYMEIENPAQQRILEFCAMMSDQRLEHMPVAVDGCGVPVYAVPLRSAARSYIRFGTLTGTDAPTVRALGTVRNAMMAFPEYMSDTGDFDAELMRAYGGNLVCKGGAEGVHALTLLAQGIAVVPLIGRRSAVQETEATSLQMILFILVIASNQRRSMYGTRHAVANVWQKRARSIVAPRATF
ncbi:MAG: asparaginase [Candidatus Eremiobacteraeota bacterium]|nr:asparaginase [Candidatus Eremiobacteraeota bacterium]